MKRTIALFTLLVMLITSMPMSAYALAEEYTATEREGEQENIYYSDIFYSYPRYLKDNLYLNKYQADSSALINNVLSEYVTTGHFKLSVASQVLSQGYDIASVIKYVKNNMNYQNFVFENELDLANRLLIQALSENDITKSAGIYSKNASEHVKNFSALTELAVKLEESTDNLEDMDAIEDDIDVYETLLKVTFDFLGTVTPRLKTKLPEINDALEHKLGDTFEDVSKLADALELASAVAVTMMAQEAQLELVYQILNDAPTDSMLYKGMVRLRDQLEGGAVTFFAETFLQDALFKKVIDLFSDGIFKAIGGKVASLNLINIGIAVVNVINTVFLKWIAGADYDTYISAVLLTDYKQGLADTLDNMSDRYAVYFSSDDIIAYDNVFNTYITVNKEVYNLYCKLSEHNETYNSAYTSSLSSIYEDMSYEKYISEVKAYILSIPEDLREIPDRGTWQINGDAEIAYSSETVEPGKYYIPRDFKGSITVSKGNLMIGTGDSFTVEGDLNVTGNNAKVTNNGDLTVTGDLTMGTADTYFYNYGTLTVENMILRGYYRMSFDNGNPEFYNYGKVVINNDLNMTETTLTMMYMTEGEPELWVGGDINAAVEANFNVTCGTLLLNGSTQQSVKHLSVNNLTVTNPEGVKYLSAVYVRGRYDLCGNPLGEGAKTYLDGNGSLAPNNDYKNVSLNCDFTFEGNIKANISVNNNRKVTVPDGMSVVLDGNLTISGGSASLANNGDLTITGDLKMGYADTYFYNYGTLTVENMTLDGHYRQSYDNSNAEYYNYGKTVIRNGLTFTDSSLAMLFMTEGEPELFVGGDINAQSTSNFNVTCGTLTLNGGEQQSVKNLVANNLTVYNPKGIKYLSSIYVKGRYDPGENPVETGPYITYLEGNGSLVPNNNYGRIELNSDLVIEGNITGDLIVRNNRKVTVPEGVKATIYGNLYVTGASSSFTNNGDLTITGDLIMGDPDSFFYNYGTLTVENMTLDGHYRQSYDNSNAEYYNYGKTVIRNDLTFTDSSLAMLFMTEGEPELFVGGDINAQSTSNFNVTCGTLTLNGSVQQSVKGLSVCNITVTNPEGIKYQSDIYIKGRYNPCGNPIDTSSYCTKLEGNASLAPDNDYGDVHVNCNLAIEGDLAGRLSITTNGKKITVAEGTEAVFDGLVYLYAADTSLVNDGTLTVTDSIVMGNNTTTYVYNNGVMTVGELLMKGYYGNSYTQRRANFYNNGELTVADDILMEGTEISYFYMNEDDAVLRVGGDITGYKANSFPNAKGKVIFNGREKQTVKYFTNANIVEIENESYEGVTFTTDLKYTTLFDHKGNRFSDNVSNIDYDGDGLYDRYDPKPTVNEKCSVIIRDYDVLIGHGSEINHIRYASGIHETSASIRNAEDCVNISSDLISENIANNVYTRNMPDGGIYTFWIRLNDGTIIFRTVDMSQMKQRVSADGVRISLYNLYGVKDFFIAEGDFDNYSDIKNHGYIFSAAAAKLAGKHSYTHTVSNPGRHTVLVRYTDTSRANEVFKVDLAVEEPTFSVNGLQITIGNIPDVKVIRTAYGEYYTPGDVKRAEGARNFSNKTAIKNAESYKIQYREEGRITVTVEYNNGYIKVFHHTITQKKPTVEQDGNNVTFGDLDGLVMVRYALGEYTTSSEIKNAKGSKALKNDAVADGKISVTDLTSGVYTFCVQYDDESYNYYKIVIE